MCNFIQFNSFHCCIFQSRTQRIMGFFLFLLLGIFCFVMVSFKQCIHDRTRQGWHKLCHWFWWNLASLKGSTQNYFSLSLRKFGQKWGEGVNHLPCIFENIFQKSPKNGQSISLYYHKNSTKSFKIFIACCPTQEQSILYVLFFCNYHTRRPSHPIVKTVKIPKF